MIGVIGHTRDLGDGGRERREGTVYIHNHTEGSDQGVARHIQTVNQGRQVLHIEVQSGLGAYKQTFLTAVYPRSDGVGLSGESS